MAEHDFFDQNTLSGQDVSPVDWLQQFIYSDGSMLMRFEDWFQFLVSPTGDEISVGLLGQTELSSLEQYLTTFVAGAALFQMGEEPLHATVIAFGQESVALLGASGAGKSTLAARLIADGGVLVTDDLMRVDLRQGVSRVHPGTRRLKLFAEPASRFLPKCSWKGRLNPLSDKFIIETDTCITEPVRLSALVQLDKQMTAAGPKLSRLGGSDSLRHLLAATMNQNISSPDRRGRQFRRLGGLSAAVPFYSLSYPRRFEELDEVSRIVRENVLNATG